MKPKFVYHGTDNGKIKIFEPRKPRDIGKNKDNKHEGVYATDDKKWAKIMGIISGSKGISSLFTDKNNDSFGVVYSKKPKFKKYFYVYSFGSGDFKNIPKGDHQYICFKKVKPLKVEKFLVKDYKNFILTNEQFKKLKKKVGGKDNL